MTGELDDQAIKAAVDVIGRTGASEVEVGHLDDEPVAGRWYAHAQFRGLRVTVEAQAGPVAALETLARRLLRGGQCQGCKSIVGFVDEPDMWVPTAEAVDVVRRRGVCDWRRDGDRWVRGCGEDPPAGSTRARLAVALVEAGAPVGMIRVARAGHYDDYLSDLPLPIAQLMHDLGGAGLFGLAQRVAAGEFDATKEEGDAWAASPDGQEAFAQLTGPLPGRGNRQDRRRR